MRTAVVRDDAEAHRPTQNERRNRCPRAERLLMIGDKAQLIVVSSHGRGGFAGMTPGSVGQAVLHAAEVPVIIARSANRPRVGRRGGPSWQVMPGRSSSSGALCGNATEHCSSERTYVLRCDCQRPSRPSCDADHTRRCAAHPGRAHHAPLRQRGGGTGHAGIRTAGSIPGARRGEPHRSDRT
ncbi:universal stress protein [Nocardia gamkensis]|uniref:universal stress protein n=1 Tax=Nocardia gamkensis TaxID=352869 RepID=UPI0037CCAE28